ncbi:MAG: carboxymuconolactone decarboxylase family protein [Candidatus Methanomethylophilaceae archaeon]|nr:carboxymuconolactone decarboxylase family protein [Candidatus Methanomethylophilaceae archaeon]MDD3379051.1 carboxymuconolactone decarboxylase family protein [Candidatus Methanomethylophilaceae archaeon]
MQEDPKEREITNKILKSIEEQYGFIPVVNQILSERPDKFISAANFGKIVMEGRGELDQKTRYLAAVAASTAIGGQYCIKVQMDHAIQAGATKDEILETMLIGSYMAMTRAQSYAFREYSDMFKDKKEQE